MEFGDTPQYDSSFYLNLAALAMAAYQEQLSAIHAAGFETQRMGKDQDYSLVLVKKGQE